MKLGEARTVAESFLAEIGPYCHRAEIGGSIRRGKPEVKDVEIVAQPIEYSTKKEVEAGLGKVGTLHHKMVELEAYKAITLDRFSRDGKKPPFGPRYYRLTYLGAPLDLFCVIPPAEWGVIFTFRTGSANFSHSLAAYALKVGLQFDHGQLFKVTDRKPRAFKGIVLPCPEEKDVFQHLGIEMDPPEKREP